MKTQLRNNGREGAFTYMTVVITMIVVGLMLAAYLKLVAVQNQLTMRSQTWNRSVPVLEAGIEEALAHLNRNASPDAAGNWNPNMTADGWQPATGGGWYKTNKIGDDMYWVNIAPWPTTGTPTNFPSITSTGFVSQLPAFALNRSFGPFVAQAVNTLVSPNYSVRVVQATTTNLPTFTRGLVAKHMIDFNGKNAMTDSFDSTDPNASNNGRYDLTKARDHGDIGSNDTITNTVNLGNAIIKGNVSTGPLGTIAIGPLGMVGDSNFVANAANRGKVQSGHSRDDLNVEFPNVPMPDGSLGWTGLPSPSSTTIDGTNYNYVLTGGNDYRITSGDMASSYYIQGPGKVRIRVDTGINLTGNDVLRVSTNATLELYLDCESAKIGGQGIANDGQAVNFYLFGSPRLKSIDLGGNSSFTGVIYAPNAALNLNGGGSSWTDFSGSAMVDSAKFNGNFKFHFDEALPKKGLWHGFVLTSWNEK